MTGRLMTRPNPFNETKAKLVFQSPPKVWKRRPWTSLMQTSVDGQIKLRMSKYWLSLVAGAICSNHSRSAYKTSETKASFTRLGVGSNGVFLHDSLVKSSERS